MRNLIVRFRTTKVPKIGQSNLRTYNRRQPIGREDRDESSSQPAAALANSTSATPYADAWENVSQTATWATEADTNALSLKQRSRLLATRTI